MGRVLSSLRKWVSALVDFSGERPYWVVLLGLFAIGTCWGIASRLELHTELRELLPQDSPGFQAYERQARRVDGGASLIVIAESPDRAANERFIGALAERIQSRLLPPNCRSVRAEPGDRAQPSGSRCNLVRYIETGTEEVKQYFEQHKWLYPSLAELEDADETLDLELAKRAGLVEDLGDSDNNSASAKSTGAARPSDAKKDDSALDDSLAKLDRKPAFLKEFPGGYFASADGHMVALRVVSRTSGLGGSQGGVLAGELEGMVKELQPSSFAPNMQVGFAGDIPNAIAEQKSLASEAAIATGIALVLVLSGVVFYYRSLWSLVVIGMPAFFGVGAGYAFATIVYGYVNTVGAFLGAIILGNGINYPIVLLSRYRDFRARGMEPAVARREAVLNAFRAELVGASVAAIAYGSLMVTRFRGFSQFGTVGFFGMFAVWLAIVPLVPALVVIGERLQPHLPAFLRDPPFTHGPPKSSFVVRQLDKLTTHYPIPIVVAALAIAAFSAWHLPTFLRDPWEYNFAHLGSRHSKTQGAGSWSRKADAVFGGKMNIAGALMLADRPERVPLIKQQILANDRKDPEGTLIADIATVDALLPGTIQEQRQKLAVLDRIRERLKPGVVARLSKGDQDRVARLKPPEDLKPVGPADLPPLLRHRFEENDGTIGAVFYVKYRNDISFSNGRTLLRMAKTTDNVVLPDGSRITTASRSTVFAEMIRSMERDGPLATAVSFVAVALVVTLAAGSLWGMFAVVGSLVLGVLITVLGMSFFDVKINFLNFIALPITFGIGCEYPFNLFDRARLFGGDVKAAILRSAGPVALCSYTTSLGYFSLTFADNQALQSFGRVAALGEVACTFSALIVLPALLTLLNKSTRVRRSWTGGLLLKGHD